MQNESKKGAIITRLIDSSLLEEYIQQGWRVSKPAKPYGVNKWAYWVWCVEEVNSVSKTNEETNK